MFLRSVFFISLHLCNAEYLPYSFVTGVQLGSSAYCTQIRRIRWGNFTLDDAYRGRLSYYTAVKNIQHCTRMLQKDKLINEDNIVDSQDLLQKDYIEEHQKLLPINNFATNKDIIEDNQKLLQNGNLLNENNIVDTQNQLQSAEQPRSEQGTADRMKHSAKQGKNRLKTKSNNAEIQLENSSSRDTIEKTAYGKVIIRPPKVKIYESVDDTTLDRKSEENGVNEDKLSQQNVSET